MKVLKHGLLLTLTGASLLFAAPTKDELKKLKEHSQIIVGYFPNWGVYGGRRFYSVKDIPFKKLTHINLAFADIAKLGENNYTVIASDNEADIKKNNGEAWNSKYKGNFGQLLKYKEKYPHLTMMLSIGGWSLSSKFTFAAKNQEARQNFAKNAVAFMKQYHFDGIDIDWEYPTKVRQADKVDNIRDQGTPYSTEEDKYNFTLLLEELRKALNTQGENDGVYYQLTAAVSAAPSLIKKTEPEQYSKYLDFVNVMSYDLHGAWENRTNHQSPLYANPNLPDDKLSINDIVASLHSKGIPFNKLVIGSPFYTRGWKGVECENKATVNYIDEQYKRHTKTVSNKPIKNKDGSPLPGLYCYASGGAKGKHDGGRAAGSNGYYYSIKNLDPEGNSNSKFNKYRDQYSKVPYLYNKEDKLFYTYEDAISVKAKASFAKEQQLAGLILWDLSYDVSASKQEVSSTHPSLINVVYEELYSSDNRDGAFVNLENIGPKPSGTTDKTKSQKQIEEENSPRSNAEGAAKVNGIPAYDPEHRSPGEENQAPHYNKGEKVSYSANDTNYECTAKYWIDKEPSLEEGYQPWDCKETQKPTAPHTMTGHEKTNTENKANALARKLQASNNSVKNIINNDDNDKVVSIPLPSSSNPNKSSVKNASRPAAADDTHTTTTTPLSPSDIEQAQKELSKCTTGRVYNTGDVCKHGEKWYKFKWWTNYDGSVVGSMEETKKANAPIVQIINAKGIPKWSSSKVYTKGGFKVVYDHSVFTSKWWTSGDVPVKFNASSPWKYEGVAKIIENAPQNLGEREKTAEDVRNAEATPEEPIIVAGDKAQTTATYNSDNQGTVVSKGVDIEAKKEALKNNKEVQKPSKMVFRPYIDATSWPPYEPEKDGAFKAGIKHYVFSFINSSTKACSPTWGSFDTYTMDNNTLNILDKVSEIRKKGGTAMVSFGGAAGTYELPRMCNVEELTAAYKEVVDELGVKLLDFDIEGGNSVNKVNVLKRMKAIKALQNTEGYKDIKVSFTLAVMPAGLEANAGLMILRTALAQNVKIDMVNLMLMDYSDNLPAKDRNEYKMAAYSIQAIESVNSQLKVLLKDKKETYTLKDDNYYYLIGATPMIGQNDVREEWFFPEDITRLVEFAKERGLGMLSMWSLNRDKPLQKGESEKGSLYRSTKLTKEHYEKAFTVNKFGYAKELLKGEKE